MPDKPHTHEALLAEISSLRQQVNDLKYTEKALQDSQRFMNSVMNTLPNVVYIHDMVDHCNVYANRQLENLLGYTAEEIRSSGTYLGGVKSHPDDRTAILEHFKRLSTAGDGEIFEIDFRLQHKRGEWRWFNHRHTVFSRTADGRVHEILGVMEDVTDTRRADELRGQREKQLRYLVRDIDVGVIVQDANAEIITVNPKAAALFGSTPEEMVGKSAYNPAWETIYPDGSVLPASELPVVQALRTGQAVRDVELGLWRSDKQDYIWLRVSAVPQYATDGSIVRVICSLHDISEQRQAELTVRRSEELYRALIANLPNSSIMVYDRDLRCILAGGPEIEQAGLAKWYEGQLMTDTMPAPFMEQVKPYMMKALQGTSLNIDVPYQEQHYKVSYVPLRDDNNEVVNALILALNITESKKAELALRESEERFSRAFHVSPLAVVIIGFDNRRYIEVNEAFCRLVGCTRDALIGHTPEEVGITVLKGSTEQRRQHLIQSGVHISEENQIRIPSGEVRDISHSIGMITIGGARSILAIIQDITDRKRAEHERERLIMELEARNAEMERFTYTVSHDLKSPLITIQGFLGYLLADVEQGNFDRMAGDIDHIRSAADKMQTLLDDLLELSRIGRLMNPPQTIDLNRLMREVLILVDGQIHQRGVQVIVQPDLPEIWADKQRILEVFQNLLDNAVKFMGDQPAPLIEIGAQVDETTVTCFVRDNGIGIAPRYHEKIFGLFERLDPSTEGTGIGLALVKRIIEVHQGEIWIESAGNGMGSTFFVRLPKDTPNAHTG